MDSGTPLLALRIRDACHALEPGRTYVLGSAPDCDLRVTGALLRQARIDVRVDGATLTDLVGGRRIRRGGEPVETAELRPGDELQIGDERVAVVVDDGTAALVPIPELRQAAFARRAEPVRVAAAALRHAGAQTFQDTLAEELRRAPWLLSSLLLHLLLLVLFWWFGPREEIGGLGLATIGVDVAAGAPPGEGPPAPPEVTVESDDDLVVADPEPPVPDPEPVPVLDGVMPRPVQPPVENVTLAPRRRTSTDGDSTVAVRDEHGVGSGSFRAKVAELQESGLEIVFVFDSTGSMTRTIADTKATIVQMLDVLRTLVPDARIGLVTYRDRGRREDYLVRQAPLDLDYWHASNFVQFVVAEGGGDRPEDVRAGLTAAFRQHWRPGARRVVVLAGDAPPHREDLAPLLQEVRGFVGDRRSFVHTLVTSPDRAGEDTVDVFRSIAAAGNGASEPIEHHDRVLQRVLSLAFGREFDRDLEAVIRSVERERDRVDVASLHLVRRGGDVLRRALLQRPVTTELWNAVVRRPRRATATVLLDLLGDPRTPLHTRHACAAALQRVLELPVPPIEPESGEPPSQRQLGRLHQAARRLPE